MTNQSEDPINQNRWFPIRTLAELCGVGTSTLRAWERRYGLLQPERTPKGHRLYQQRDVERVNQIVTWLQEGHSFANIKRQLAVQSNQPELAALPEDPPVWDEWLQQTLIAVSEFSAERLNSLFNQACSEYPMDLVTEKLLQASLDELGEAWRLKPQIGIAEEHFYSNWLQTRLAERFHKAHSQANGPRIVCCCTPGTFHEMGLMLFSLSALARGYRVVYLGADLPLNQLPQAILRAAAKAVVLGANRHVVADINAQLTNWLPQLPVPVFIGGAAQLLDRNLMEQLGGIWLGENLGIAIHVLQRHLPIIETSPPRSKQP